MPIRRTTRVIAWLAAASAILAILFRVAPPSGELTVVSDLIHPSPFLAGPKPWTHLTETDDAALRAMAGSPVYFDLRPPGGYDAVSIEVKYRGDEHPSFAIGALAGGIDRGFIVRPVSLRLLEDLAWPRHRDAGLTLFDRRGEYDSVSQFMRDPPDRSRVAVFGVPSPAPFRLGGYAPSAINRQVDLSLRGRHRFGVYIKEEAIRLTFALQDMNRAEGADPVVITMYRDGDDRPLSQTTLEDDGNVSSDQRSSGLVRISAHAAVPEEGLYWADVAVTDDVFIRKITTANRALVVAGRMAIGDLVGYSDRAVPAEVAVRGSWIGVSTPHVEGLQTVAAGGEEIVLGETNVRYVVPLPDRAVAVRASARDIVIETDGVIAFRESDLFPAVPYTLSWASRSEDLDRRGIDFILAAAVTARRAGEEKTASTVFGMNGLGRAPSGAYRFALIADGLEESGASIEIESVRFTFKRTARGVLAGFRRLFAASEPLPRTVPHTVQLDEQPE